MRLELHTYIRTSISYKHLVRLTDGRAETDGQTDGHGRTYGGTDKRTERRTDRRTDMNGHTDVHKIHNKCIYLLKLYNLPNKINTLT